MNWQLKPSVGVRENLGERLTRASASIAVVALFSCVFALAPYNERLLDRPFGSPPLSFTGGQFLIASAFVYSCILVLYHLIVPDLGVTKSVRFFGVLWRFVRSPAKTVRNGMDASDRIAVLSTLLKGFFAPLMVMSLMGFCMTAGTHLVSLFNDTGAGLFVLFNQHGFWILMQTILFIDVLIFTVGYLIETPRLANEIRSVDPTIVGWAAALFCYPPFNTLTSKLLGSQVSDFPQFDDPSVHIALNALMLILMACYASASVALGFKASNLTHRGVVARFPYSVVRHPAYVCKNLAWWISAIPLVSLSFQEGLFEGASSLASVAGWTMLYIFRALTEEDHLRSVDGEYAAYAEKVRYRFIPGIY